MVDIKPDGYVDITDEQGVTTRVAYYDVVDADQLTELLAQFAQEETA